VKNKIADLNDHLFAQLERLGDEELTPEQIETEARRGSAIVATAEKIINIASLQIQAAKIMYEAGEMPGPYLPQIGGAKS
jgi:hypothetical protein